MTIDYDEFPKQGTTQGRRVKVAFGNCDRRLLGVCVRCDTEAPFQAVIKLDDGRFILGSECQFSALD